MCGAWQLGRGAVTMHGQQQLEMDTTHMLDCLALVHKETDMQKIGIIGEWTWRERERKSGLIVAEKTFRNKLTTYGLTALGSAISGAYTPPLWLAVENSYSLLTSAVSIGATSVSLATDVHQAGDTQITLGAGQANQETVTFTSVTGTGPFVYALSTPLTFNHTAADPDWVVRTPQESDATSNLAGEVQYDATNFPNQRMVSPGGYSPGSKQWTVQFFFPGPLLVGYIMNCGLVDNVTVGAGNLHNHFTLGIHHTNTANDQEIDGVFTFSNV